jgi:uncharacterized RDD family membrane protein YckC
MSTPVSWTGTEPANGPAPGVEWASPGSRLVGYVVDVIIQGALSVGLFLVSAVLLAIFWPIGLVATAVASLSLLLYFPYFWQRNGQTPGMRLMQIKVVRDKDGGPVTWGAAFLRLFGYWLSGLLFYIGYLWILIDRRKRGWFDLLGGTVVVAAPDDRKPV